MRRRSVFGWVELLLGAVLLILGVYTFINPEVAVKSFVILYGVGALISGVADIALYVRLDRRTGFGPASSLVGGILSILVGILLLFNIQIGVITFAVIFPIWFIVHCISRLANLGFTRMIAGKAQYYVSLVVNILGLILGLILLFNPLMTALWIGYVIALYLVISGIGSIINGISKIGE